MQILCETLSSIIAHKEIRHIDNAVDVLWKLYTVYPEIVPFRSFGNLLIDIIIFVSSLHFMFLVYTWPKMSNLFWPDENSIEQCFAAHIVQGCQQY